jgi:hypothetical protein
VCACHSSVKYVHENLLSCESRHEWASAVCGRAHLGVLKRDVGRRQDARVCSDDAMKTIRCLRVRNMRGFGKEEIHKIYNIDFDCLGFGFLK